MMIDQQKGPITHVVDQFDAEDFGAPFKILLKDSVSVTTDADGNMLSYTIPDPEGLMRVIVLTRILNRRKLSGKDIKFLRKAVCVMQKDLAVAIEILPETLSRYEAEKSPIGPGSEKLLRLFLFKTAIKHYKMKESDAKKNLEKALDKLFDVLKPVPVHDADDELVMTFCRRRPEKDAGNDNQASDEEGWEDPQAVNA